jgi:trehalose-phosphatase
MFHKNKCNETSCHQTRIKSLFLDYDGTISPLNTSRSHSQVPAETFVVLQQISRRIPVIIVSTKDLSFLLPRTPFAHAWCGITGIEVRIGKTVKEHIPPETALQRITLGLQYAKSNGTHSDLFVEEKRDSCGRAVAFCLDWRQASDPEAVRARADMIVDYCEKLGLKVFQYRGRPFYDVYPVLVDKGNAVREIREELKLEDGTLYMGDSEIDNSAFAAGDISLGVTHDGAIEQNLVCDYLMKYSEVTNFLTMLLANDMLFSSDFPVITTNPQKMSED